MNAGKSRPILKHTAAFLLSWTLITPNFSSAQPVPDALEFVRSVQPVVDAFPPEALPQEMMSTLSCDGVIGDIGSPTPNRSSQADDWGSITVAHPKVWQFERVSALLDGLLRDVEGVSLSDLTQLDPNAQNAAAVKFVQSALEVGVQYDQAAAVTNSINRENFQLQSAASRQRFAADNSYIDLMVQQRNAQTAQLLVAQNTVNQLQPLDDAKTISPEQKQQLEIAKSRVATLTASVASINDSLGKAGLTALTSAPALQNTTVQAPAGGTAISSSLSGFADVIHNLPQGVQDNLNNSLKAPTLPATKRLDNFITLLYERLSREISVLQDDLTRSPDNVAYLLQFDVGLYPSKKAKNHAARVEFEIDCPECKVYSIYPGQSSYNIGKFSGSSKRTSVWGNLLTLIGFGASASYRRQVDMVQGGLQQSVYTAGFQDGVGPGASPSVGPVQRFGWYYGSAPFEERVSPGMRSTFAIVTVPRASMEKVRDAFGNSEACLPFKINSAWAKADNPMRQYESFSPIGEVGKVLVAPFHYSHATPIRKNADTEQKQGKDAGEKKKASFNKACEEQLFGSECAKSVEYKTALLRLPEGLDDLPIVAKRQKNKLHVVRMEYNTVFEDVPAAAAPQFGSTTPSSSGVPSASPQLDPLTACPPQKCAGMLLRFDRPIDPNLVVTVRGEPLKRVRDWRGRATSVLPASQSGSDLTAQATSSVVGSLQVKQLVGSRSLLEADQVAPNTWFALNSYEVFLNISVDVATEDEFPAIQITDPSSSVLLPFDLDKGTADLVINGLHMRPQTPRSIERIFLQTYASDRAARAFQLKYRNDCPPTALATFNFPCPFNDKQIREFTSFRDSSSDDAPVTAGPYAYTTFVPLFVPDAAPQRFYARLGESKDDLLIGFQPHQPGEADTAKSHKAVWREGHSQVVLEDRDLDFAWSLSCFVQGQELACHLPRAAIQQVYGAYATVCPDLSFCPGAKESIRTLQLQTDSSPSASQKSTSDLLNALPLSRNINPFIAERKGAYLSTLQVWVTQADTDDDDVFYSAEPARIDFFPLSDNFWTTIPFKQWQFESATSDAVFVKGCNYFANAPVKGHHVTFLGSLFDPEENDIYPSPADHDSSLCGTFKVPTLGLTRGPLVFRLDWTTNQYPTPLSIPTFKLRPQFSEPDINEEPVPIPEAVGPSHPARPQPHKSQLAKPSAATAWLSKWVIDFRVARAICSDTLDLPDQLRNPPVGQNGSKPRSVTVEWLIGNNPQPQCADTDASANAKWANAGKAGNLHLKITVPHELALNLPPEVSLIRHSRTPVDDVPIASLPNLRALLLPTSLTLESVNPTQFILHGENAGAIAAVLLHDGKATSKVVVTAGGRDYALVTATVQKSAADNGSKTPGQNSTSNKTAVTRNGTSTQIVITENSQAAPPAAGQKQPIKQKTPPPDANQSGAGADSSIPPGTYSVIPLFQLNPILGTAKPPNPVYVPLPVITPNGKPLTFTVADPAKSTTPKQDTSTLGTACVIPCLTQPCLATCPSTTPKPSSTSTP